MAINIIFENKYLLFVMKESGCLSVPSRWGTKDQRPVLGIQLQNQIQSQIYPVHRLDEETSGIMVFAKDSSTQRHLNQCFEKHLVIKKYQALTIGCKSDVQFNEMKNKIVRGKKRSFDAPHGQDAITKVEGVIEFASYLLWSLRPLTGRSHQLRFQLASRGFPILGDELYGSKVSRQELLSKNWGNLSSIALRAVELDFSQPFAESIEFAKIIEKEKFIIPGFKV